MKKATATLMLLLAVAAGTLAQTIVPNDTFSLGRKCYDFKLSDDGNKALVFFIDSLSPKKQKGMVGLYDLAGRTFRWTRECGLNVRYTSVSGQGYQTLGHRASYESSITPYGSLIVDGGKCVMVGDDGAEKWQAKLMPVLLNQPKDVLLGYSNGTSQQLRAYRLSDGRQLWQQKVGHGTNWGWDGFIEADDTTVVVAADDVNFINVVNGSLAAYKSRNGFRRTGDMLLKALAVGVAGGMMGAMTGVAVVPTGNSPFFSMDVYTNTCSNIFGMGGKYYVSDRNRLSCLDHEGNAVWTHEFPSKTLGNARITGCGNRVTIVNYAFGLAGGVQAKPCGRPFVASFNATTGDMLYCNWLSDDKEMVEGAAADKDYAFVVFPNRIVSQQLADSTARVEAWNTTAYGNLTGLIADTVYTYRLNDFVLTPLHTDSARCVVVTDKDEMKVVNRDLKIIDDFQASNLFLKLGEACGMVFLTNGGDGGSGQFLIAKADGEPVGIIGCALDAGMFCGNNLYLLSGDKIMKIDFTQIRHENDSADGGSDAGTAALRRGANGDEEGTKAPVVNLF